MKMGKIIRLVLCICVMCGAMACHKSILEETSEEDTCPENSVKLSFDFSKAPIEQESRAGNATDELLHEESVVNSLLYAIFKNNERKHFAYVNFAKPMHTGQSYSILKLKDDWFDTTTEIFALANIGENDTLKMNLENATRIDEWKNRAYKAQLNRVVGEDDSRTVNKPVMAGYLNLKRGVTDKINVKMERVYCRIWFSFLWRNHPLADNVTIDEIKISGLHQHSKLFNYHQYVWEDTVGMKNEIKEQYVIKNKDDRQLPFIGRLTAPPYFNSMDMNYLEKLKSDYNILCRFPWSNGQLDQSHRPMRYYVYSLQRGGTSLQQDPLIEIKYKYQYPNYGTIYKKASAYLYDKISSEGKQHHGLLRNYTYQLNCIVNTVTNSMDIQVVSVPWYNTEINDIPPFE